MNNKKAMGSSTSANRKSRLPQKNVEQIYQTGANCEIKMAADSEVLIPGGSDTWVTVKSKISEHIRTLQSGSVDEDQFTELDEMINVYYLLRDKVQNPKELEKMGDLLAELNFAQLVLDLLNTAMSHYTEPAFTNLSNCKKLLCNLSDKSVKLCTQICECGLFAAMLKDLELSRNPEETTAKASMNSMFTLTITQQMLTVYNVLFKHTNSKKTFRQEDGVNIMVRFVQSDNMPIKTTALLTLALAADLEESNELLQSTESNINYMMWLIDETLKHDDHRTSLIDGYFRFRLDSLVHGLSGLSTNASNAQAMIKSGVFDRFIKILQQRKSEMEVQYTIQTLWNLSFLPEAKTCLKENSQLMKLLKELKETASKDVKIAIEGISWELTGKLESDALKTERGPQHIMISYNWDHQDKAKKLLDNLRAANKNVWMDIEKMEGDMLQKMADAVENSYAVIVCLSEAYRDSANCRTEATYAYKEKIPIIPVMMEPGFKPSGWLGILVGMNLYYDLTRNFDDQFGKLLGFINTMKIDDSSCCSVQAPTREKAKPQFESWTHSQVSDWWKNTSGVSCGCEVNGNLDGRRLSELKKWREQVPEFFLNFCRTEMKICDPMDLLAFSSAIQKL